MRSKIYLSLIGGALLSLIPNSSSSQAQLVDRKTCFSIEYEGDACEPDLNATIRLYDGMIARKYEDLDKPKYTGRKDYCVDANEMVQSFLDGKFHRGSDPDPAYVDALRRNYQTRFIDPFDINKGGFLCEEDDINHDNAITLEDRIRFNKKD